MFGTLRPHSCAFSRTEQKDYDRFYCGVCQSLGEQHGTLSRAMLSHDAVFMALLVDGLLPQGAAQDQCRCPLMPLQIRKTVQPQSPAMRYATAVQMVLGDQFLADRAMDGKGLAKICRPLLSGHVQRARQVLDEMGLSLAPLSGFESEQARCEVPGLTGPAEAAAPSAAALGYIFSRLVDLPGAGEALRTEGCRQALRLLGEAVGRVIYYIDALEDLKKDFLGGAFNPCLAAGPQICPDRVALCCQLLAEDLARLPRLLEELPWQRHRELCRNILCDRLPHVAQKAMAAAQNWAGETARARLLAWKALPLYQRAPHVLLLWLIGIWTWFYLTGSALAGRVRTTGQGGGGPNPCSECGDAFENCTRSCGECSELLSRCTNLCNHCNDCQKCV